MVKNELGIDQRALVIGHPSEREQAAMAEASRQRAWAAFARAREFSQTVERVRIEAQAKLARERLT